MLIKMKFNLLLSIVFIILYSVLLTACGHFSSHQTAPLTVHPIVIPSDVPSIKSENYYEAPVVSDPSKIKPPSLLPPGSALHK